MPGLDAGDAEVPDQAGVAQLGEHSEVFGDRVLTHTAEVHQVQVVAAELMRVLLDVGAQLIRPGGVAPLPAQYSSVAS